MRLLIVDDNAELCDFLCLGLGEANIEAVGAAGAGGGDEVVRRIEDESFDLVVIDSILGEIDGIALAQRLRSGEKGRAVPIVLMSGIGTGLARRMAMSAGCNEFLVKPFTLSKLIEIARRLA